MVVGYVGDAVLTTTTTTNDYAGPEMTYCLLLITPRAICCFIRPSEMTTRKYLQSCWSIYKREEVSLKWMSLFVDSDFVFFLFSFPFSLHINFHWLRSATYLWSDLITDPSRAKKSISFSSL